MGRSWARLVALLAWQCLPSADWSLRVRTVLAGSALASIKFDSDARAEAFVGGLHDFKDLRCRSTSYFLDDDMRIRHMTVELEAWGHSVWVS